MHKRIILLAKIALIIAAAQIQITAANFISTQTNTTSNATYAMSNAEEQTFLGGFKKYLEESLSDPTTNQLSNDDQKNIEQKIQNFIKDDEEIALALYIANQWDITKELGWKNDAVSNYVQRCLRGLYNSTQEGPTIQVDNPYHKAIAAAIENLNKQPIGNNKPRDALRALLYPGLNQSNQQTELDNAEGQEITNDTKELTFNEEKLIYIIYQCAHIFKKSQTGKTNKELQPKTGLILKHISKLLLPIHASDLKWIRDNKDKINKLIAGPGLDLQEQIHKATINEADDEITKIIYKICAYLRPDLPLTTILLIIHSHNLGLQQHNDHEDKAMIQLAQQIKQNIERAFLSSDVNGANQIKATHSNNPQTQEEKLLKEFLNFIMGWDIPKQTSQNNRSTIFKDAAAKIRKEIQPTTSIKLTQTQKDLLKLIKIAYSTQTRQLIGDMKQLQNDEHNSILHTRQQIEAIIQSKTYNNNYHMICIEKYEQILEKVLAEEEIEASQIAKELETKFTELQQEEDIHKETEESESYANAFCTIAYTITEMIRNYLDHSNRPVLDNLQKHIIKLRNDISHNTIYNDAKTIESCLDELFTVAYAGIDDDDKKKTFINKVILPHLKLQITNQQWEHIKDKTAFIVKRLLILIRLIVQAEIGQYNKGPQEEVSSAKEGPTQATSTSINKQESEQDDSLLNEYHITHRTIIEGNQTEQHINFKNIPFKELQLPSELIYRRLNTLYYLISSDAQKYPYPQAQKDVNEFDTILQILNKEILNEDTNTETDVQNSNLKPKEQIIIEQTEQIRNKLQEYISELPKGINEDWEDTTKRYIKHLQWILKTIKKEEVSTINFIDHGMIPRQQKAFINRLQKQINNLKIEKAKGEQIANLEAEIQAQEKRESYVNVFTPIAYSLLLHGNNHLKSSNRPVLDNIDHYTYNIKFDNSNNTIYNEAKTIESCLDELFTVAYAGIKDDDKNKTFIKTVILPHQKRQCKNNPSETQNDKTAFKLKRLLIFIRLIVQAEIGQYEEEFRDKEEPTQSTSTSKNLQAMEQNDSLLNEYHITHKAIIEGKSKEQHIKCKNTSLLGLNLLSYRFAVTQKDLLEHIRNHEKQCPNDCVKEATNKLAIIQQILNDNTNIATNDQKTNEQPEAQTIINQTEQLSKQIKEYINELPKGTNEVWADTTNRYITHLQWILQRITKKELSHLVQEDKGYQITVNNECINILQETINNQRKRMEKEEAEQKAKEKEEKERLKKEEEERERKEKAQGSKIATTQKIINNLSATNKMIQIIMQILY